MMRWPHLRWALAIGVGMLVWPTAGGASTRDVQTLSTKGALEVGHLQVPKGSRISSLEVDLVSAAFESVSNIPPGWHISISNEQSWRATLRAEAEPGAPLLDGPAIENIGFQIVKHETGSQVFSVSGTYSYVFGRGDRRQVPLDSYNFEFIERYPRHRLY